MRSAGSANEHGPLPLRHKESMSCTGTDSVVGVWDEKVLAVVMGSVLNRLNHRSQNDSIYRFPSPICDPHLNRLRRASTYDHRHGRIRHSSLTTQASYVNLQTAFTLSTDPHAAATHTPFENAPK